MINKSNLTLFPRLKTELNFYGQKSILQRHNLPINLYESLTPRVIKRFKKLLSSISKKKLKQIKRDSISKINNNKEESSEKKNKKHSMLNTETELKMNKIMALFNIDKKLKKNAEYDLIKGRMFKRIKNYLILKAHNYHNTYENNDDYSLIQKQKEYCQQKKYDLLSKKKINIITDSIPKLFNTERITRRFEDLYMTPEEFLNKNFKKEEIDIMIKNANYFKLNKEPLKEWDLNINLTLKDTLEKEEKEQNKNLNTINNNINIKQKYNNNTKQIKISKQIVTDNNENIPKKNEKIEKYSKIPKLNLKDINRMNNNNIDSEKIGRKKIKFSLLCLKNSLLYSNSRQSCSRHEKHCRMNNLTDRDYNPRMIYRKSLYVIRNNIKHIKRFESKKNKKIEFAETQNVLNEIKSNYMKKYHEKVTQDNIIKNKNLLNNLLQINIRDNMRRTKTSRYIKIANHDQILLSKRLWKS